MRNLPSKLADAVAAAFPTDGGLVLWRGRSPVDGAPIVLIATGLDRGSKNSKTGALVQTWILRADVAPHDAQREGQDVSVCGNCPQRMHLGGGCYVLVWNAPLSTWRKYKRGGHRDVRGSDWEWLRTFKIRAGSYGDPAMVPTDVWARLQPWTGYTHQWERPWAQGLQKWCMASVDSVTEMARAEAMGWRCFLVNRTGSAVAGAVECPSPRVSCLDCGLCQGTRKAAKHVWIAPHGYVACRVTEDAPQIPQRLKVLQ